tara:strand:+ start:1457 stop:3370 length:1914 start_codon:yes stop_codon:yes gene_type:complete
MAFTSSYTPGLIQQSEYIYGTPDVLLPGNMSGSAISTASFGTYLGDASQLTNIPAGVSSSYATTASYVEISQTASYVETAQTASYVLNAISSSYATTASYVNPLNQDLYVTGQITASGALTIGGNLIIPSNGRIEAADGGNVTFISNIKTGTVKIQGGIITGSNILATDIKTTSASGSFSGSFEGDGSGLTGIVSSNLYTTDGTVGTNRVATIGSSLTWTGGQEIRISNSRIIREVTQDSDLPTALVANTTYVIRGSISTSTNRTCNVEGVEILGQNRDLDEIVWTGTGAFLTLTDCSFSLQLTKFSSTTSGNSILSATNVAASGYNNNRLKILSIINCQFRGTFDVMDINGYDLVDINNTLFFYVKATNFGLRFRDTSKIEISSCELLRWFDESTIPTPSGYSTVSMIELQNNNLASFGAVNINGCIVHPQQTQNGINIGTSSTTGFGTIAANAFINVGLTTGKIFLPQNVANLPDYSLTSTVKYDIFSNQGLLNSNAGIMMTVTDNTQQTSLSDGVPAKVDTDDLAVAQASVRFDLNADGRCTYIGSKQIYVSVHVSIGFDKGGSGTDSYVFYIYKDGVQLSGSKKKIRTGGNEGSISMVYGTLMETDEYLELWVEVVGSNDNMGIEDLEFLIRE